MNSGEGYLSPSFMLKLLEADGRLGAELVCLGNFGQGSVRHIRFGIRLVHTPVSNTIGCPAIT